MSGLSNLTRRHLLQGTAAGACLLATPSVLRAAGHSSVIRPNMASAEGQDMLKIYRKAVANMWALPPSDPHNWFRYALIHLMDCPHGNWWFFVWHRPYITYLEQAVRIYGEDTNFALPYWDWTAQPFVAPTMFAGADFPDNALDPTSSHFPDWATFEANYHDTLEDFWNTGLTSDQKAKIAIRRGTNNATTFAQFWGAIEDNYTKYPEFGRRQTASAPNLDPSTQNDVELSQYQASIESVNFVSTGGQIGFNSGPSLNHSGGGLTHGQVEAFPHNNVHNDLGPGLPGGRSGWMPSLLSSVDPIFFLHHCNVDRLWDVWIRRQEGLGQSFLPTAQDQQKFNPEEFLFYVGPDGATQPGVAGQYMDPAQWDFSYTDGTASDLATTPRPVELVASARTGSNLDGGFRALSDEKAAVAVPDALADLAGRAQARQVAKVTFTPPMNLTGVKFQVFVAPEGQEPDMSPQSPELAATFSFFGMDHSHGDVTLDVDITKTLNVLQENGMLEPGGAFHLALNTVEPEVGDMKFTSQTDGDGDTHGAMGHDGPARAVLNSVDVLTTSSR